MNNQKAFTLIELLVVVLIIGILAAVALPQYQKAVWKSRYATMKAMVNALADAEEAYYLANGEYTTDFDALGVELPGCTNSSCQFSWGYCRRSLSATSTSYVECLLLKNGMFIGYQRNFNFSVRNPAKAYCYDYVKTGLGSKICQSETGRNAPDELGSTHGYSYP